MSEVYDIVIIGGGPGGVTAGVKAAEAGLSYVVLEKGDKPFQGIIDAYPRGKKVCPTIPKGSEDPFPVEGLTPPKEGERLLLLSESLKTSRKGIYAIGGAISPSYMEIQTDGTIRERKHTNLIYTAMQDAARVINSLSSNQA